MASFWDRYARARISRRRALGGTAAAGALLAAGAVVGCGGSGKGSGTPDASGTRTAGASGYDILNAADPPRPGGTLVSANAAAFGTFDPHLGVAVASAYFPRVYNVLVNQSATKPEFMYMDLAESFEIPDANTFIFKIRPGVRIAPNELGVPERDLDGEDVRVTLERLKTDGATNNHAFARDYIDTITVGDGTVTVTTPAPYAWFLNRIGLFFNTIVPREALTGDLSKLQLKTAGAGAYRLMSVTEGESARFERNPNYYRKDAANGGAQLPYIDALDVRTIYDRATQRTAFQSGQIHLFMTGSGAEARSLSDAVVARDPNFNYISFTMNPKRPPFDDPRVRRAISRAINRDVYADIVYGGDAQPDGMVQWSLGAYALPADELTSKYQPFDVDEAKRMTEAVGGIKFKMMFPADTPILEHSLHLPIFLEQMRAAGIEVEQDAQEFTTWIENYRSLNYQCSLALNQIYETPELPLAFHTSGGPFGDKSYIQGLGDAEIDAAVKRTSGLLDFDERVTAVHDAQRVIYDKDPMMLPLVTPYSHFAWRKNVRNIPTGIGTTGYLINTMWMET
ncbi:MAG TPA: ABC transporter substrate-binding protein [Dehalococcoidia bacterium]